MVESLFHSWARRADGKAILVGGYHHRPASFFSGGEGLALVVGGLELEFEVRAFDGQVRAHHEFATAVTVLEGAASLHLEAQ